MNYVKCLEEGEVGWRGDVKMGVKPKVEGGLEAWCKVFCKDSGAIKSYVFLISILYRMLVFT